MKRSLKALLLGAVLFTAASLPGVAAAKIVCNGIFQQTSNGAIATPYCGEQEIAIVARSYGEKVTDAEVHNNPMEKVRLCYIYGNDNRLKGACGAYSPENYGRP